MMRNSGVAEPPISRHPRTIRRSGPLEVILEPAKRRRPSLGLSTLPLILVTGFAAMIAAGTLLLTLPISSESGEWTSPTIALFVATSAVCVTGLVPVDTASHWNGLGEAVILLLIQFGGLGFMTSTTLIFLLLGWRVGIRERLFLSTSLDLNRTGGIVRFTRRAFSFTLIFEFAGFVILTLRFLADESLPRALWMGLFHSVSAFNNAGFDLFGGFRSLADTRDAVTLVTISVLIVTGGFGYMVLEDLRTFRRSRLSLDSTLIVRGSAVLLFLGFAIFAAFEWNRTLAGLTLPDKVLQAAFLSVTPRTAGFANVAYDQMSEESHFVTMALMFIGGGSGSTAGGIKVGTLFILLAVLVTAVRGRPHIETHGREIRRADADRALAIVALSVMLVFIVTLALSVIEHHAFLPLMFEATSAFSNTGLTTGVTPGLSEASFFILALTMFLGRLGPLTLALTLVIGTKPEHRRLPEERLRIG